MVASWGVGSECGIPTYDRPMFVGTKGVGSGFIDSLR